MGVFLNPTKPATKESWLLDKGTPTPSASWIERPTGSFPVCLTINGIFVSANIAHNVQEFKYLLRNDGKSKHWFYAPVKDLLDASDLRSHRPKDRPYLAVDGEYLGDVQAENTPESP
jgi:hypothetical protein